jgi:hypothetical protein
MSSSQDIERERMQVKAMGLAVFVWRPAVPTAAAGQLVFPF